MLSGISRGAFHALFIFLCNVSLPSFPALPRPANIIDVEGIIPYKPGNESKNN
jgi:hypothetical protein